MSVQADDDNYEYIVELIIENNQYKVNCQPAHKEYTLVQMRNNFFQTKNNVAYQFTNILKNNSLISKNMFGFIPARLFATSGEKTILKIHAWSLQE